MNTQPNQYVTDEMNLRSAKPNERQLREFAKKTKKIWKGQKTDGTIPHNLINLHIKITKMAHENYWENQRVPTPKQDLTLMEIQHLIAEAYEYKSWAKLIKDIRDQEVLII